jgi:anti-sigma28 factor (negative regulator of flagellin synthesis)
VQISNTQINKVFELHMHKVNLSNVGPMLLTGRTDQLTISGRAAEMQSIKQFASKLPDTREDMVHAYRGMIADGTYQLSDYDLASAMFDIAKEGNSNG